MIDQHINAGYAGKYFTQMLNMADDDLDPFEYRLLGHYIRVCGARKTGVCYQTIRTIATATKMSVPQVIKTRDTLAEKGWINVEKRANKSLKVTVIDRMAENVARYASGQNLDQVPGDQNIEHGDQNFDHRDQNSAIKEEPNKKNQIKKSSSDATAPDAKRPKRTRKKTPRDFLFDELCVIWNYDPATMTKTKRGNVARIAGELLAGGATPDDLKPFYNWCKSKGWTDFTINVFASRWDDYKAEHKPAAPVVPLSDAEKEAIIASQFAPIPGLTIGGGA